MKLKIDLLFSQFSIVMQCIMFQVHAAASAKYRISSQFTYANFRRKSLVDYHQWAEK